MDKFMAALLMSFLVVTCGCANIELNQMMRKAEIRVAADREARQSMERDIKAKVDEESRRSDQAMQARLEKETKEDNKKIAEYLNPTKICLGMSSSQVFQAWGQPIDSMKSTTRESVIEIWTYGLTYRNHNRAIAYLTFVNGQLVRITNP